MSSLNFSHVVEPFISCPVFMILSPLFMIGAVLAYLLVRELGKEEQRKMKQGLFVDIVQCSH